ncbi:diphthamide synthesis protein [Candidatus Woesearchaeota archaeon]|nr:diphthamide synthesis protein [Candidatus Woesearchaeota archaeon]
MNFDLELEKAVKEIKKNKAKLVLIQLPDGLKPQATSITDYLEKKTKAKILIWSDSCYGACDIPNIRVDLIIQFGHNSLQPKI